MEGSTVLENMDKGSSKDEIGNECVEQKFYSPLCLTGYLTPLQRKKLREKRSLLSVESLESRNSKDFIKPLVIKRKRESYSNVPSKSKKRIKKLKSKECISQIQCTASKIIFETSDIKTKDKKFFKTCLSNRLEKANFSMPLVFKRNVFLNIDKCVKKNLCCARKRSVLKEYSSNPSELIGNPSTNPSDSAENVKSWNVVAPCLIAEEKENSNKNMSTLQSKISRIGMNQNLERKEKSVFDFDWPSDELLLKRQEEARANMKKQKVLNESDVQLKDVGNEQQNVAKSMKLYPVFYNTSKKQSRSHQNTKRKHQNGSKRMKESLNGGEQMIIDAGQKEIGAKICSTCNMIYSIGLEDDEKLHSNYHNMYLINLKFLGWKEENVIGEYRDGRVIMIRKNDQSFKLRKIEDILDIANRDLGFSSSALPSKPDLTFILFISNVKQVGGCVIAEPISSAYRVILADSPPPSKDPFISQKENTWSIVNWYSSSETTPAVCGINRIWVAHGYRRCKVASRMIDCLRCHFIHGHVIGIRELAFTDPSPDGRVFAAAYTGTDDFLVYR